MLLPQDSFLLDHEYGVKLSVQKTYEIQTEKYVLRSKWKKRTPRGAVPVAQAPREVVQMDTIDFGGLFVFTIVDV